MKKNPTPLIVVHVILLMVVLVGVVYAAEESPSSKFLGSPLLVLTAIIIIDVIAYLYRKIRKVRV